MEEALRPPRRFRRRLLIALIGAALLPLLALGVLTGGTVRALFEAVSFTPLEASLEEAEQTLRTDPAEAEERLSEVRLSLAQAELARRSLARRAPWLLTALVAIAALIAAIAAVLLGRSFARPIQALTAALGRVGEGDLTHRIDVQSDPREDELALVQERFNVMSGQLAAQRRRLEVSQRLAAWQDVARSMGHELKNPLTAIKMSLARLARVELVTRVPEDQTRLRESLALLDEQVDALMRMTQSFSDFARLPALTPRTVELDGLVREVCALFDGGGVPVRLGPVEAVTLTADPDQLRRALVNLIKNAVEATPAGGEAVEVAVARAPAGVRITVRDHGTGVPRPLRMGEFVHGGSQKPGGSGLGLPITQKIVHEHGGSLALDPAQGGGTLATVELPLS